MLLPNLAPLLEAAAELDFAVNALFEAREAVIAAKAAYADRESDVRDKVRKFDAARRAAGIFLSVEPLSKLDLKPIGERERMEGMATKNELGYKLKVQEAPEDVKQVKASASVAGVVVLEETFDVPGESVGEFWVEQGSLISVSTQTIDDSGNVQTEEPKVFTFVATDTFPPAPLSDVALSPIGERTVEVEDAPTDPPADPPTE
jgi:hypothetical protein